MIKCRLLGLFMLFSLLAGCATFSDRYQAPSFTYQSIEQEPFGVIALKTKETQITSAEENQLPKIVTSALQENYTGISTTMLPKTAESSCSMGLELLMTNASAGYAMLQNIAPGTRYLVVVHILKNTVKQSREIQKIPEDEAWVMLSYRATRDMTLKLDIYDLQLKRLVFSVTQSLDRQAENRYRLPESAANAELKNPVGRTVPVGNYLFGVKQVSVRPHRYPNAPKTLSLFHALAYAIVSQMPEL